jgi:pilus assembly protein CpaC
LVTVSGRPASFTVGGEFPILVPAGLGTVSIEYKTFGTQVDFVPIVLGNGRIRLEVRPRVSELDAARGVTLNNSTVPALQVREVDTGVELRAGQTLALAGLVQNRIEVENKGLPILADLPYFGAPFRRVSEKNNEIELLIMVTPELVEAMEQHEVPPVGPGMHTISPSDHDLYWRGHLEVPNPNMPQHSYPYPPAHGYQGPMIEEVPPSQVPAPEPAQVRATQRATAPLQAAAPRQSYQGRPAQAPRRTPAADQVAPSNYADLYRQVGAQTPRRPTTAATQVQWVAPSNEKPQNPSKANSGQPDSRSKQQTLTPEFIGPVGYDVKQ